MEPTIKFYVFHQWHLGKSAYIEKGTSPAEYSVIAAAHSQQNARVMGEGVRESVNQALRQANSEVTANDIQIVHDVGDLIQTLQRQSCIDMDKPKNLPPRGDARQYSFACHDRDRSRQADHKIRQRADLCHRNFRRLQQ